MLETLSSALNASSLQFMTHKLFMHYVDKNTKPDSQDPAWLNQGVFFWNNEEVFEKKSLPPEFKSYSKYSFFIKNLPESVKVSKSQAIPWFGMEGNGDKYCFTVKDSMVALSNIYSSGIIQYIKFVTLTEKNLDILQKRKLYMFHFEDGSLQYDRGLFFKNKQQISVAEAYDQGYFKVIQLGPDKDHD